MFLIPAQRVIELHIRGWSMSNSIRVFAFALSITFLTGCGLTENMDKMKETTDALSDRTDDLYDETRKLAQMTAMLLREQRQGVSQEQRREALRNVLDPNMPIEIKMKDAAVYYNAFEFQLWENILEDDERKRQDLFAQGVEEFMISFRGVINGKRPDPDPLSTKPQMQSLFALAATLEQINLLQTDASFKNPFRPVSMLDLILDGLAMKSQADENPQSVPPYVLKLLGYEDEARYILELRYNIFSAIVVDKSFDVSQMSLQDKLKMILKGNLSIEFSKLNAAEIVELTNKYMYGAIYVRDFMRAHGTPINLNKNLMNVLKKAVIKEDPTAAAGKKKATQDFKEALRKLLCEGANCPQIEVTPTAAEQRRLRLRKLR